METTSKSVANIAISSKSRMQLCFLSCIASPVPSAAGEPPVSTRFRVNESQRRCTKVGRWTAHQRIASFQERCFGTVRATSTGAWEAIWERGRGARVAAAVFAFAS